MPSCNNEILNKNFFVFEWASHNCHQHLTVLYHACMCSPTQDKSCIHYPISIQRFVGGPNFQNRTRKKFWCQISTHILNIDFDSVQLRETLFTLRWCFGGKLVHYTLWQWSRHMASDLQEYCWNLIDSNAYFWGICADKWSSQLPPQLTQDILLWLLYYVKHTSWRLRNFTHDVTVKFGERRAREEMETLERKWRGVIATKPRRFTCTVCEIWGSKV